MIQVNRIQQIENLFSVDFSDPSLPSIAKEEFISYISKNNTSWTNEDVEAYAEYIWNITSAENETRKDNPNDNEHEKSEPDKTVISSETAGDNTVEVESVSTPKSKSKKKQGKQLQWLKNGLRSFLEIEDSDKSGDTTNNSARQPLGCKSVLKENCEL